MVGKEFKTHNVQLRILRSRGLLVKSNAKRILEDENYYNVVNGYKDLFLNRTASSETYTVGAEFSEIYALYEFDRRLRFIFLKGLLKLENKIKSVVAYKFSKIYGSDNYLKLDNFEPTHNDKDLGHVIRVISDIHKAISIQCGRHESVTHYVKIHGYVPLWVLVNVLTFGSISKLYGVLKIKDRQDIAREFGLPWRVYFSYLKLMTQFRNICAHDERFYSTKIKDKPIKAGHIHASLSITKYASGIYKQGVNDVFALLICLKELFPNRRQRGDFPETVRQIGKELDELAGNIHTININTVLVSMGFPSNWKSILW